MQITDNQHSDLQITGSPEKTNGEFENAGSDNSTRTETPYSILTKPEKLGIILLVAFAAVFSPLSSFIYFPALTAVANDLHTTLSKINLTITSYMIVSGVVPMVLGNIADQLGRRPVYLFVFFIYALANVGLALQTSYPVLLVLRMLQSAGGSATVGLGFGILGDIAESSERGAYMGILCSGPNAAPSLGPVLGGILVHEAGWRWTFGFLAISGALSLLLIAVILPETARNIVGNGSLPVNRLNKSLLMLWQERKRKASLSEQHTGASNSISRKVKLRLPSPMDSISVLLCNDTFPIILVNAVFYAALNCLQASLSALFINIYGYKELEAGLIYLPFGVGCFIATLLSSKILTNDYRCIAIRQGLPTSSKDTSDAQRLAFPLFQARLRSMVYLIPLSTLPLLAYGWCLQHRLHPSVPLILQFFMGGSIIIVFNACGTLIIDLHPSRPSTAQASMNIVRCTFAAGSVAALQPLINAVGIGWCFTIVALITGATAVACVITARIWGERWRKQRQSLQMGEEPK